MSKSKSDEDKICLKSRLAIILCKFIKICILQVLDEILCHPLIQICFGPIVICMSPTTVNFPYSLPIFVRVEISIKNQFFFMPGQTFGVNLKCDTRLYKTKEINIWAVAYCYLDTNTNKPILFCTVGRSKNPGVLVVIRWA